MQRRTVSFICLVAIFYAAQIGYAESELPPGYGLLLKKSGITSTDKILLSLQDDKLAFAISEGLFIATIRGETSFNIPYESTVRIVKICRYFYDKGKRHISFERYVMKFCDKHWNNGGAWWKYFRAYK